MQPHVRSICVYEVSCNGTVGNVQSVFFRTRGKKITTQILDYLTLYKQKSKNGVMYAPKTIYKILRRYVLLRSVKIAF